MTYWILMVVVFHTSYAVSGDMRAWWEAERQLRHKAQDRAPTGEPAAEGSNAWLKILDARKADR